MGTYYSLAMVTALALAEYSVFGALVGRARAQHKVIAPATTGNPEFERYFRVHQNTLEALIVFVPAVWIFSLTVHYHVGVALGVLFLIARIVYASGYLKDPAKRAPGALLSFGVNSILVLGSIVAILIKAL
jgi:glutathione S-transferase